MAAKGDRCKWHDEAIGTVYSGSFLWDLSNFHEHVPGDALMEKGRAQGFHAAIMGVELNQCAARRFVGWQDLSVLAGYESRGIAAGRSFDVIH